jgi:RNA polymerase sigma factor for flagellar operon FliA
LYYDDELNLREIGEVLEVSESRVCQIHGQALLRLRSRLGQWIESTARTTRTPGASRNYPRTGWR